MKNKRYRALGVLIWCWSIAVCSGSMAADLFVAPDGDDAACGTRIDTPFRTLRRAKEEVRVLAQRQTDVLVLLRGGVYRFGETEVFTTADSAPEGGTIRYKAYPGETPRFVGSVPVEGWRRLPADYPGVSPQASGEIWVTELEPGFRNFKTLYQHGRHLPRARSAAFEPMVEYDSWTGPITDTVEFPAGALGDYRSVAHAELFARTSAAWAFSILPVRAIDMERGVLTTEPGNYSLGRVRGYATGSTADGTMWIENVLEELTEPGEWVLDPDRQRLYLWPLEGSPQGVTAPVLAELLLLEGEIDLDGMEDIPVTGIHFEGIEFTEADRKPCPADRQGRGLQHGWDYFDYPNALVRLRGAAHCSVTGCHFRMSGGGGIRLDLTAYHNRIENNLLEHLGGTGILLAGYGVGLKDVNRFNTVRNNHIHRIGELKRDAIAVWAYQSGHNLISRNLIHDVPYTAISISCRASPLTAGGEGSAFKRVQELTPIEGHPGEYAGWLQAERFWHGRFNQVEHNEVLTAVQYIGDGNAVYISGTGRSNEIRGNFIHHNPSAAMHAAIRCDDLQHETLIVDNVVYRHYGHGSAVCSKGRNDVINNYFIKPGLSAYHTGIMEFASYSPAGSVVEKNVTLVDNPVLVPVSLGRTRPHVGHERILHTDLLTRYNVYRCLTDPDWARRYLTSAQREGGEQGSLPMAPDMRITADRVLVIDEPEQLESMGIDILDPRQAGLDLNQFPPQWRDRSVALRSAALEQAMREIEEIDARADEPFSFVDSFEHYAGMGMPSYYRFATCDHTDILVDDTVAYDGRHSLKFIGSTRADPGWMPAFFIEPSQPQGGVRTLSFHFKTLNDAVFNVEHRFGAGSGFRTLARVAVSPRGITFNDHAFAPSPPEGEWAFISMQLDHTQGLIRLTYTPSDAGAERTMEQPFMADDVVHTSTVVIYGRTRSDGIWYIDQLSYTDDTVLTAGAEGEYRLAEALADARRLRATDPEANVTIQLDDGWHRITETVVLDADLSGIRLEPVPGAEPVISSGVPLTGWRRASDIPAGVPESVCDQVWQVPLPENAPIPNMLYDREGILPMAAGPAFQPAIDDQDPRMSDRRLYTPPGVLPVTARPEDLLISIIPRRQWSHNVLRVARIDLEENWLETEVECSYEMVRLYRGRHDLTKVRVLNAPEALDTPGEWFVDSLSRTIYHIPRDGRQPCDSIVTPVLYELVRIEGTMERPARGIVLDGLTFKHTLRREWGPAEMCVQHDWESVDTANGMVRMRYAEDCVLRNSRITMGGSTGVRLDQWAQRNTVENCQIGLLGSNGIFLGGLFFDLRDINRENNIRNNHIYDTGMIKFDGCGILVVQSGANRIEHNLVHDTGYSGIVLSGILNVSLGWEDRRELGRLVSAEFLRDSGMTRQTRDWSLLDPYLHTRDNIVEGNEVFRNVMRIGDGNPIYLRGAGPDNVIRRNLVYHAFRSHGGIRMDDGQWGTTVEQNIVYISAYAGIQMKGPNRIINNVVVDVLSDEDPWNVLSEQNLGSLHYRINIPVHNEGLPPEGTSEIRDNILLHTRLGPSNLVQFHDRGRVRPPDPAVSATMVAEDIRNGGGVFENNLYWDVSDPDRARAYMTPGNRAADPLLIDPPGGDFMFPPESPATEMGMVPVDSAAIGLREAQFPERFHERLPARTGRLATLQIPGG